MESVENIQDEPMLVERCRVHDDAAFAQLYQRYRLPLFSYIHQIMQDAPDVVEDIFQQTWMNALQHLDTYNERCKFFAWICRIAHNLAYSYYRKNRRIVQFSQMGEGDLVVTDIPDEKECRLDVIRREERCEQLRKAVEKLSPEQLEIVKLRQEGVSFQEISDRLQVNINTAIARMHNAMLRIKDELLKMEG